MLAGKILRRANLDRNNDIEHQVAKPKQGYASGASRGGKWKGKEHLSARRRQEGGVMTKECVVRLKVRCLVVGENACPCNLKLFVGS